MKENLDTFDFQLSDYDNYLNWPQSLAKVSESPGVYWFLSSEKQVIYVGKAKNLKNRLTNYRSDLLSNRIKEMVGQAIEVRYKILESELLALLVEAELIKLYQPKFNVLLKDDKSFIYIALTKEEFPRVLRVRKNKLKLKADYFGPYPSAYKVKEILKLIRKVFPWCNQNRKLINQKNNKPCFYYHLDLCPGVCCQKISQENYLKNIQNIKYFLQGKTYKIVKFLKEKMFYFSQEEEYEKASQFRDRLEIVEEVISENFKLKIDLTLPILTNNSNFESLVGLKKILVPYLPVIKNDFRRIEAYDASNTSGQQAVVSMITFINGMNSPENYRIFKIKTIKQADDYGMLKEALLRRCQHFDDWGWPDLIVLDGGKGQLKKILEALDLEVLNIVSLAKKPDRLFVLDDHYFDKKLGEKFNFSEIKLSLNSSNRSFNLASRLLINLRDHAHNFAKKNHLKLREKALFN
jgi:excinuclease ABC subunit C